MTRDVLLFLRSLGTEMKALSSFLQITGDSGKEKKMGEKKHYCILIMLCKGTKERNEMASIQFVKYMPLLDDVDDVLGCVC